MGEEKVRSEGVIAAESEMLNETIAHLGKVVQELVTRIAPVLRNVPSKTGGANEGRDVMPQHGVALADYITRKREDISAIIRNVEDARSRIEL